MDKMPMIVFGNILFYVGWSLAIGQVINFALMALEAFRCFVNDRKFIVPRWLALTAVAFGQIWLLALMAWNGTEDENKGPFWQWYFNDAEGSNIGELLGLCLVNIIFLALATCALAVIAAFVTMLGVIICALLAWLLPLVWSFFLTLLPLVLIFTALALFVFGCRFVSRKVRQNKELRQGQLWTIGELTRRVWDLGQENASLKQEVEDLKMDLSAAKAPVARKTRKTSKAKA